MKMSLSGCFDVRAGLFGEDESMEGQGILILGALSDDIDGLMQVKDEIITECGSGFSGQGRLETENQLPACSKNSGCVMVTDHTSIFIEEAIPGVMIFIFDRPMVADFRQELWRAQMGGIKAAYVVRAFRGRFSFVWIMEGALHTGELAGMGQAGRGSA